jgi:hypothetical protein
MRIAVEGGIPALSKAGSTVIVSALLPIMGDPFKTAFRRIIP